MQTFACVRVKCFGQTFPYIHFENLLKAMIYQFFHAMLGTLRPIQEVTNIFASFQTKSIDLSWNFELLPSFARQNLAAVAPRKDCQEMSFREVWCISMHFAENVKNEEISNWTRNTRFYRTISCDAALERFFSKVFERSKLFGK